MQDKWLPGTLRERIRDLCKSRDISQTNLAQELGIDKSTLSRFLTEKTNKLSSDCLVAIAGYFGVSTDFLLGLTNIATRKTTTSKRLACPPAQRPIWHRAASGRRSSASFWKT